MHPRAFNAPLGKYTTMPWNNQTQPMVADPSSNSNWMLDHHIMLMVGAEANDQPEKRWTYFKFVFDRILPYMDPKLRKALEAEQRERVRLEFEIRNSTSKDGKPTPEPTKKGMVEKLRLNFIETHEAYIYLNLPRTGIIQLQEDGVVDFTKHDFEEFSKIVRNSKGFSSAVKEAVKEAPNASG